MRKEIIKKFKSIINEKSILPISTILDIEINNDGITYRGCNHDTFITYKEIVNVSNDLDIRVSVSGRLFLNNIEKLKDEPISISKNFDYLELSHKKGKIKIPYVVENGGEYIQINTPNMEYGNNTNIILEPEDIKSLKEIFKNEIKGNEIFNNAVLHNNYLYATDGYRALRIYKDGANKGIINANIFNTEADSIEITEDANIHYIENENELLEIITYKTNDESLYPIDRISGIFSDSEYIVNDLETGEIKKGIDLAKLNSVETIELIAKDNKLTLSSDLFSYEIDCNTNGSLDVLLNIDFLDGILKVCSGELELQSINDLSLQIKNNDTEFVILGLRKGSK